ncbi:MAG TPA: isochorismatase family cysteine hydrolase [Candidatus Saccharimonadales bacterium]|nr:isochorismatase family cysteine hydrolase [Candidatus Saccharimonadales bacterium]
MRALLVVDFTNEMVDPGGKMAADGYAQFATEQGTLDRLNTAIRAFRDSWNPVVFTCLAFDPSYCDMPVGSPVLGRARRLGILAKGTWSAGISSAVNYIQGHDAVIVRDRLDAFRDTGLAQHFRRGGVTDVYIAGVATLAVIAAALSAHDNDFAVTIIADACVAASHEDQERALTLLSKVARLTTAAEL